MFKFKFIKGKKHKATDPLIILMHTPSPCLKENNNTLDTLDTTTLVIMDEKKHAIVGGAYLTKRALECLQEDIRPLLPMRTFDSPYVWECSNICFSPSHHLPLSPTPPANLFYHFYHCLYEGLVEFGKQKRIGFIVVKLGMETYHSTKEFGLWPYIIQLLPKALPDDFFYGILPLRGRFYEVYKKQWERFEKESLLISHHPREEEKGI